MLLLALTLAVAFAWDALVILHPSPANFTVGTDALDDLCRSAFGSDFEALICGVGRDWQGNDLYTRFATGKVGNFPSLDGYIAESGGMLPADGTAVFTGCTASGDAGDNCAGFSSSNADIDAGVTGDPARWLGGSPSSCGTLGRLYCIAQDQPPAIWASETTIPPLTGVDALHEVCRSEDDGLGRTYALVCQPSFSWLSTLNQLNFVHKFNGVPIGLAAFTDIRVDSPIITANGNSVTGPIFTGCNRAFDYEGLTNACSDWTDSNGEGFVADGGATQDWISGGSTRPCGEMTSIYCVRLGTAFPTPPPTNSPTGPPTFPTASPTTRVPTTAAPTTTAPTTAPTTTAPTTTAPTTTAPTTTTPTTTAPTTTAPTTSAPTTTAPTTSAPTTISPTTSAPTTTAPTAYPTFPAPTASPTTSAPATTSPTSIPTTAPSSAPTTATPTSAPTPAPTTLVPSLTATPTGGTAVGTNAPTNAPTRAPTTPRPTAVVVVTNFTGNVTQNVTVPGYGADVTVILPSALFQYGNSTASVVITKGSLGSIVADELLGGDSVVSVDVLVDGQVVDVMGLGIPVEFVIPRPVAVCAAQIAAPAKCVWWDTRELIWRTDNCTTTSVAMDNGRPGTKCSCNHLTDFAVLLDRAASCTEPNNESYPVFAAIYAVIALYCLVVIARLQMMRDPSTRFLRTQHAAISAVAIVRMLSCLRYYGLLGDDLVFEGFLTALPYLIEFWIFTRLASTWLGLVEFTMLTSDLRWEKLRPWLYGINIVGSLFVIGLFVAFFVELDFTTALVGTIGIACVYMILAISFLYYSGRLVTTMSPGATLRRGSSTTTKRAEGLCSPSTKILLAGRVSAVCFCVQATSSVLALVLERELITHFTITFLAFNCLALIGLLAVYQGAVAKAFRVKTVSRASEGSLKSIELTSVRQSVLHPGKI